MNLQKFRKAELISKIKNLQTQNNHKNLFNKILNYILLFKSFLIKITLIGLLIKLFKKYSLIRRIGLLINWIILSIFGLSITDIYGSEFISNILSYWRSTQFYIWLTQLFGIKINEKEIPSKLESFDIHSTTNSQTNENNNKIVEWFDKIRGKEPEIIEIEESSNLKYYIIAGVIITISGCFVYHYWDDISISTIQIINWFRTWGRRGGDDPGGNSGMNPTNIQSINIPTNVEDQNYWNRFKHKLELWKRGNNENISNNSNNESISRNPINALNILSEEVEDIVLEDNSKLEGSSDYNKYFKEDKGKGVLTSPSLEDLTAKTEESWSNSKPSSPSSNDSSETIKPIDLKKVNTIVDNTPSSSSTTNENINLFNEGSSILKPFLEFNKINSDSIITEDNFKSFIYEDIQNKMNFIEFTLDIDNEITKIEAIKCVDKLVDIITSHDNLVRFLNEKEDLNLNLINKSKEISFLMREWIVDNAKILYPDVNINLDIGNKDDIPQLISKTLRDIIKN